MKKVAIVTAYHENYNFGGQLQAYALQKKIASYGLECEVIDYIEKNKYKKIRILSSMQLFKRFKCKLELKFHSLINSNLKLGLINKKEKFDLFISSIPHTNAVSNLNYFNLSDKFNYFITGSDQVFNPEFFCLSAIYLLDNLKGKKISYAASSLNLNFNQKQKKMLINSLNEYSNVSVREDKLNELITGLTKINVKTVLDPTLLYTSNEWDKIAINQDVHNKYAFVYLIHPCGSNIKKQIYNYCQNNNLKMIIVPHAQGWYKSSDEKYYDEQAFNIGPCEWIGYIKNAEIIFTDSFHGTIFSIIYHKKFWSFESLTNDTVKNMQLRKYGLLNKLGLLDRCIPYSYNLQNNMNISKDINFEKCDENLYKLRKYSIDFLEEALDITR